MNRICRNDFLLFFSFALKLRSRANFRLLYRFIQSICIQHKISRFVSIYVRLSGLFFLLLFSLHRLAFLFFWVFFLLFVYTAQQHLKKKRREKKNSLIFLFVSLLAVCLYFTLSLCVFYLVFFFLYCFFSLFVECFTLSVCAYVCVYECKCVCVCVFVCIQVCMLKTLSVCVFFFFFSSLFSLASISIERNLHDSIDLPQLFFNQMRCNSFSLLQIKSHRLNIKTKKKRKEKITTGEC